MWLGAQASRIPLWEMITIYSLLMFIIAESFSEVVNNVIPNNALPIIMLFPETIGAFDFANGYYLIKKVDETHNKNKLRVY